MGPPSRPVRVWIAVLAANAMAMVTVGCDQGSRATPVSPGARHALAGRVLDLMDGNGLPVQNDHIGCLGGVDGRSDKCYGLTSDEPVQRVEGDFTTSSSPGNWSTSGCSGQLVVTIGPTIGSLEDTGPVHALTAVSEDPCR